jgi:WD40 repeat protein
VVQKSVEIHGHSGAIYTGAYDGEFLYTGSADQFVTRWDIHTGIQDKFAIQFNKPVYSICLYEENHFLAVGLASGDLHLFDLKIRKELKYFTQHKQGIFSIEFNSVKHQLYTGDADGNLSIWDTLKQSLMLYLPLNCGKIRQISCSADGNEIALSCQDGTTRLFDTERFNENTTLQSHSGGATAAAYHPFIPNQLITGGKDAHLKIWEINSPNAFRNIPAHNFVIYDILVFDNGKQFATASRDKTIKIWSTKSVEMTQRIDLKVGGHKHSVNQLISIDEHSFISVGDDKRIILWKID